MCSRLIFKAILSGTVCLSLCAAAAPVYADTEVEINENEDMPLQLTPDLDDSQSGSSETNTSASSGSSSQSSDYSLEDHMDLESARTIYHSVTDILKDYIGEMESLITSDGLMLAQRSEGNPISATSISFIKVPVSEMYDIGMQAMDISQYLADSEAASFNEETKGTAKTADEMRTPTITDAQVGVTDAQTESNIEYEDFFADDVVEVWNAVADDAGLSLTSIPVSHNIYDFTTGGYSHGILWNSADTAEALSSYLYSYLGGSNSTYRNYIPTLPNGGYRSDLLSGGFYDADNWLGRFTSYAGSGLSNAMDDDIELALIDEFRISSVTLNEITNINYLDDYRKWIITDEETGEEILQAESYHAAEENLAVANPGAGTYLVTEYQHATYTSTSKVYYKKYQYLFDANTKNLLYFNESMPTNDVIIGQEQTEGFVATSVERVRVNSLGEIENVNSGVERVE